MPGRKVALIVGANGTVGRALSQMLARTVEWDILALSRQHAKIGTIGTPIYVDILDRTACEGLAAALESVTHVFYCARATSPDPAEEERLNVAMFTNVLDVVEKTAPSLAHIQAMHGTKWYGCHLGAYKTPAFEDDPRHFPPNFYYAQHDMLVQRKSAADWTWSTLRPHTVWGITLGYRHSFVVLLAAYATICRHLSLPLIFPGSDACFDSISQATDATLLAKACLWAATTPQCSNNSFNIINGDVFRWRYLWPKVAAFFDMQSGPVQTTKLSERASDKAAIWEEIVAKHGLRATNFADLGDWAYFDFTLQFDYDDISDTMKARRYGFNEFVETESALLCLLHQLRDLRVIP